MRQFLLLPLISASTLAAQSNSPAQMPAAHMEPCRRDSRFREFDFWVGDWDVRPTGRPPKGPPSRNVVTLEDNGCVVMEHWTSTSGSEGQSFNIYDRAIGQWRQTWVDKMGEQHDYRGGLKNGDMAFLGETPAPNGARGHVPTRLTFFHLSADSVRQFSEVSSDSGRTWKVNYDLTYVRRPGSAGAKEALAGRPIGAGSSLTDADRRTIAQIDSTFVAAWLRDDTVAVLNLFAPDAVLLPPGAPPATGIAAIRAFWWPKDGSRTRITSFERTVTEVNGGRDLAFTRGVSSLRWEYTKDGKTTVSNSRSVDVRLFAPDAGGRWRIARQMWNVLP